MSHWRRRPVVVEAWQFMPGGQCEELPPWIERQWFHESHMLIPTPAGILRAEPSDWIIRGVKGDVYPCRADVFAATYESAAEVDNASGGTMSKSMDRKKETKKKAAKSFDEKRAAKREKRDAARR